jgi:hypothetical protein
MSATSSVLLVFSERSMGWGMKTKICRFGFRYRTVIGNPVFFKDGAEQECSGYLCGVMQAV